MGTNFEFLATKLCQYKCIFSPLTKSVTSFCCKFIPRHGPIFHLARLHFQMLLNIALKLCFTKLNNTKITSGQWTLWFYNKPICAICTLQLLFEYFHSMKYEMIPFNFTSENRTFHLSPHQKYSYHALYSKTFIIVWNIHPCERTYYTRKNLTACSMLFITG